MKQLLCLLIFMLSASSCGNLNKEAYESPMAPTLFTGHVEEQAGGKDKVWEQLIVRLEKDGFVLRIDSISANPLVFELYDDKLTVIETIVLQPASVRTISAKAAESLAGTALYPRFSIKEARFADNSLTDSLVERIESIIYSSDPINEKVYDRIIRLAPNRLIYLSTDAKAFSAFVATYADSISHLSTKPR